MKKITAAVVVAMLVCSAGAAFSGSSTAWVKQNAAGGIDLGTNSPAGTNPYLTIKPSANVFMGYIADAAGVQYVVGTYHGQGVRAFSTSSVDTNLYYRDFTTAPGVATAATTNLISDVTTIAGGTTFNGWTASK